MAVALRELGNQGFGTFVPLVTEVRARQAAQVPAFPGYVFIRFDLARDRWRAIAGTYGMRRLFGATPERPTPVREREMAALLAEGWGKPMDDAGLARVFDVGAEVQVVDPASPWHGQVGICQLSEGQRITLLMSLFGRSVRVQWDARQVQARDGGMPSQAATGQGRG
jgi:transcriptional antiterminator RfaH